MTHRDFCLWLSGYLDTRKIQNGMDWDEATVIRTQLDKTNLEDLYEKQEGSQETPVSRKPDQVQPE